MKIELHDTHSIGGHFLSYLINGDATGLNDEEHEAVLIYEDELPPKAILDVIDLELGSSITKCAVSGFVSECYTVDIYIPKAPTKPDLTAAASDLYQVVKKIADLNPFAGEIGAGKLRQLVDEARNAQAKALGERA